jgi:hypothetical protein
LEKEFDLDRGNDGRRFGSSSADVLHGLCMKAASVTRPGEGRAKAGLTHDG